jgi:hypothetical protein
MEVRRDIAAGTIVHKEYNGPFRRSRIHLYPQPR